MKKVIEEVPAELQPAADAALAWINRERNADFKLTGLVLEVDEPVELSSGQPMEFGLVLCQDDLCMREQVRVTPSDHGFEISAVEARRLPRASVRPRQRLRSLSRSETSLPERSSARLSRGTASCTPPSQQA